MFSQKFNFALIVGFLFAVGGLLLFDALGILMSKTYFIFLWIVGGLVADGVNNWLGKVVKNSPPPAQTLEEGVSKAKPITSADTTLARNKALQKLLLRIADGDVNAAAEVYQLGLTEDYMVVLLATIMLYKDDFRRKILRNISSASIEFQNTMSECANKKVRDSKKNIIISIILLVVFCIFGIYAITSFSIGAGLAALLGITLGSTGFVNSNRNLRVANEIKTTLKIHIDPPADTEIH